MRHIRFPRIPSGLAIVAALFLATCGDEPVAPPPDTADVNAYLAALPAWDDFSPPQPDTDEPAGSAEDQTQVADGVQYSCRTTPYNITRTPEKIVTLDPDANVLWPGALIQGRGYSLGIGSLRELAIKQRAPLEVSIDLLSSHNSALVSEPTLARVSQTVGSLIEQAQQEGVQTGSAISYQMEQTYSVDQAALALGLSVRTIATSVKVKLGASFKASQRTVTAYFVQRMFTVSISLPQLPSSLFGEDFTAELLAEHVQRGDLGPDNPPVYVANVVYGRILIFSLTSMESELKIRAALNASFASTVKTDISAEYLKLLEESAINVVAVGGDGQNALQLIQSGELRKYFSQDAPLTSAKPISYTVRNLGDNSIAKVSETTTYNLTECAAVPNAGAMSINVTPNHASVKVLGAGGYDSGWLMGDQLLTALQPGGYTVFAAMMDGTGAVVDTTWTEGDLPADVAPGDTTEVVIGVGDKSKLGGVYRITLNRFQIVNGGCASGLGEGAYDVTYWFTILKDDGTDVLLEQRGEVGLGNGSWRDLGVAAERTVYTYDSPGVRIQGDVWDQDGGLLGGPDLMARFSRDEPYPHVGVGERMLPIGVNGCDVRLYFTVDHLGDAPPPPAPPAGRN